jgi:hypothetical protein
MYQLVMHHTYVGGSTFDVSGKSNHGTPVDVAPGTGAADGSYEFSAPTSGIMVAPSPSLENLGALRVRMKIRTEPWDGLRRNLIEGFVSFAFLLQADGRLSGGIVDANGAWTGATDNGAVTPGRWHEVEMIHDGVSTMGLKVDGQVVAVRTDVPGPVRSVGPLGIAIGRWPDANQYVFKGDIGELQLWRFDPVRTVTEFLDCCCGRGGAPLDDVLARLRDRGVDWARAGAAARDAQQATLELIQSIRGAGPAAAAELDRIVTASRLALLRRDRRRVAALRDAARALVDSSAGAGASNTWEQEMDRIAREIGLSRPDQDAVVRALCFDAFMPAADLPDAGPTPPAEGGPWDNVPTPEPFPPLDRRPD